MNVVKGMLKDEVKSEVKKKIWVAILPYLIAAAPYLLIGVVVLIVIGFFYYLIVDPCDASKFIGTWWATMFGKICAVVPGVGN